MPIITCHWIWSPQVKCCVCTYRGFTVPKGQRTEMDIWRGGKWVCCILLELPEPPAPKGTPLVLALSWWVLVELRKYAGDCLIHLEWVSDGGGLGGTSQLACLVCVCMQVGTIACGSQRFTLSFVLQEPHILFYFFLRQVKLPDLGRLASSSQPVFLSLAPQCWDSKCGCWVLKSGPHDYISSIYTTNLTSSPKACPSNLFPGDAAVWWMYFEGQLCTSLRTCGNAWRHFRLLQLVWVMVPACSG